jgi:glycerol kinase
MSGPAVLSIDQGTSGTKAIVLDPAGSVLAVAEEPIRPTYLPGGGVEQDPAALLASVLSAGRRALQAAGCPVGAVALANQGETVLAWDRATGKPLSQAIVWQDRRAETVTADLAAAADWVAQRTGLVLDPYFSAPKMAWLRRHVTTGGVVTTTDSWLIHQLCGEFVTDAATASRSLLTGLDTGDWDPELLELFGWSQEPLPRIVGCDEVVGSTGAFGMPMAVAGLIVDQQAALLAEACLEPGTAKCTFGTGAFLLANTGTVPVRSSAGLTSSVAWRARGRLAYCLDGQVYTAASAVRWLQDLGLIGGPADLDRLAATDTEGTLCVPALAGLAAPWWRSDATASLTGMTLATRPEHVILAVVQGIAAQVAELTDLITTDFGRPLTRLRVDGGLTRSRTLMQCTADIAQLPVDVFPSAHATALGAAALARLALLPGLDLADAVPAWTPAESYEPRWSPERAAEFRDRWRVAVTTSLPASEPPR